MNKKYKKLS